MAERYHELELTGERTLPGIARENYWFQRHLAAYELARDLAAGKKVIDVGCGEGYGSMLLARSAQAVVGVDIAPEVVSHARNLYTAPNLSFDVADVNRLQTPDGSFDMAVSFQVVEHLSEVSGYFDEMVRVVRPGGYALFTTPNRLTISPGSDRPINPYHLREYTPLEFREILSGYFQSVEILGLFHAGWLRLNDRVRFVDFIKFYGMSRVNPRYWTHRVLTPLVRTDNFHFKNGEVERCLDILAVCRKKG